MKISIVIPTYNCGQYLEKAILSVLNQPYKNKELIVIDGGSTDNTKEILEKYEDRLKWISEKDNGQANAINKGFKMATGDIVAWLNADDYYEPNIFDDVVEEFKKDNETVLVYGKCNTVNLDGEIIKINKPPKKITTKKMINNGNFINQPASFYKKEVVQNINFLDDKLEYWMEYDLFIKLSKIGKFVLLNKTLANFTKREDQKSNKKNQSDMDIEMRMINNKYNNSFLNKIWFNNPIKKIMKK